MKLEDCLKCSYNKRFENGAVHCGYDTNIVCMARIFNNKMNTYVILACPKERDIAGKE